jgi:endonuclease G
MTQGDLTAFSDLPTIKELPSLSDVSSQTKETSPTKKVKQTENLEIPAPIESNKELLLHRTNYTLSFNKSTNLPNWVAWRLDKKKLAQKVSRDRYKFVADPEMSGKNAVVTQDYAQSGYDRGHMCPANDSRWSADAMRESFYMTNICPQNPSLNSGDWNELEQACHKWAEEGPIYIVCGPILYKKSKAEYIGKEHKIRVPEAFFKVVLAGVEKGKPRAVGFVYKNAKGNRPLDTYVNTVDEVERITGFDFFPQLPDEVENKVESRYNIKDWK